MNILTFFQTQSQKFKLEISHICFKPDILFFWKTTAQPPLTPLLLTVCCLASLPEPYKTLFYPKMSTTLQLRQFLYLFYIPSLFAHCAHSIFFLLSNVIITPCVPTVSTLSPSSSPVIWPDPQDLPGSN